VVELRLAVFAPGFVDAAAVLDRLDRLAAAYRPFSLASGNSLVPVPVRATTADLRVLAPLGRSSLLNVRELAGLWHLVQADDDVGLLERTTARRRLPLPASVAPDRDGQGCRIGTSDHQGRSVSVYLPDALLRRHLLAVAKTRRGKSSLLLRLARHLMWAGTRTMNGGATGGDRRALVLVDPHRDLAARAVSVQAMLPPEKRQPVTLIVDEFHLIPGADYEQICGELAKYGANLVLATQTLARLDRLTVAQQVRDLRAAVFSNLDGLFAFHTSAEDARYLAAELGGGLDEQDGLELGHYQAYARLSDMRTGERLPAFTVQLDPPPTSDGILAAELALASAERYGRDTLDVELDRQAAIARIDGGRRRDNDPAESDGAARSTWPTVPPGSGVPAPDQTVIGGEVPNPPPPAPPRKHGVARAVEALARDDPRNRPHLKGVPTPRPSRRRTLAMPRARTSRLCGSCLPQSGFCVCSTSARGCRSTSWCRSRRTHAGQRLPGIGAAPRGGTGPGAPSGARTTRWRSAPRALGHNGTGAAGSQRRN